MTAKKKVVPRASRKPAKRHKPTKQASKPAPKKARKPAPRKATSRTQRWAAHAWTDVKVTLGGVPTWVIFFDWKTLAQRDGSWADDFHEYLVGDHADAIESGAWTPIGAVGLSRASRAESFAELNNRGFLAIVNRGGAHPARSVIWADGRRFGGGVTHVADDALQLTVQRA
jgi:hypothetical protein